ncbi:MAG: metallophosphoesterase [Ferruginibacter sp.]|nr:metallophosphoesterase [Ferruginibacter sp.]
MRKTITLLTAASFIFSGVIAQDSLQSTIVLIGDAGQLTNGRHPVVAAVKRNIPINKKTTIIYLGDNLYKTGLPDNALPTYDIAKAPLDSQIHIAGTAQSNVYFIPGNHDWANGGRNGYESILRVQSYIDFLSNNYVKMYPRDGCPGPEEVSITDDITLVMMDSQWWLQEYDKPGIESDCPYKTKAEVITQLDDILAKNSKKLVLIAMHHPMRSYGPHGGFFTLKQHIFPFTDAIPNLYIPLPVIGSSYPLTRAVFGTAQDLKHPLYQAMIHDIEGVVKGHKNVIFVSGHEHTMQLIQDSGYNYIVSGSGSKTSRVSKSRFSLFASGNTGFATLEISKNKIVRSKFFEVAGDSMKKVYDTTILDFSKVEEEAKDTTRSTPYVFKDSVTISASDKYKSYTGFKEVFLGKNYRKEWSIPIRLPVFNISKELGGFTIKSLGGGKQTKSLKIVDKKGKEWTLRTIDKDPEKALPENLRGTLAQGIVADMISASDPYSPLVVPTLAKAAGVISAQPRYFFVPDDPAFGAYRKMFANTVVMLEDRDPVPGEESKSTSKVLNKLYEDNDDRVDQPDVLRARLLDMLIGDFDRHADQWKWGTADTGKGKLYFPLPRDRDQAFFNSDGLLLKYLSKNQMPFLQGFKKNIADIKGFNFVARDFDRIFLNKLDEAAWQDIADSFNLKMTNDVITEAVSKYPPEIKALDSARVVTKLESRRDILTKNVMKYYKFISREVSVVGSNEKEYFHVENDNGLVKLTVYKKNEESDSASIMYRRVFDPKVTRELRLYGLNGDDKFEIDENVKSTMKMRIIGGKGADTFNLKGNIKSFVYDLSTEKNSMINLRRTNKEFTSDAAVLEYKNTGFQYDKFIFPQINLGYNVEDKFLVGLGFNKRTYGFRKEPYATDQKFTSLYAPQRGAYQLKYQGIFNKAMFKNDIIVKAEMVNPTLNNFFGYGNQSEYDKRLKLAYYRVRNKYVAADLLLRKRYNDIFQFSIGPTYYHYWSDFEDNKTRILSNPAIVNRDSANLYSIKDYLGLKMKLDINYINDETFPSRGITWFTEFTSSRGMNNASNKITKLTSDMTIYATISDISKVTTVLRFGGGRIFTDNYEFFQAMSLGNNNYVRGYRKNRFSGDGMAYGSAELRYKVFKSKSYVLPGDVGLLGFFDIGRVWLKGENSQKWHNSVGGGLYFVPFNVVMLSATMAFSEEDRLFNFTLGTKFNLTF